MTNLKLVLRTYSALRQMSPDDIALLETLRALNDGDRELMVETLQGKATGKAATKIRTYQRCRQCGNKKGHVFHKDSSNDGYHVFQAPPSSSKSSQSQSSSKSPRASGIHAQLKERRQEQREPMVTTKDDDYDPEAERCTFVRGDGKLCYLLSDHNIHHMKTHPEYHEFESGKSAAPPAPVSSSANGGAGSTTRNSEASTVSAQAATAGLSSED